MKIQLSVNPNVAEKSATVRKFADSWEFARARMNPRRTKNIRRFKATARKFNNSMMELKSCGIIREFEEVTDFEIFSSRDYNTDKMKLAMRPGGLRYQPYFIEL